MFYIDVRLYLDIKAKEIKSIFVPMYKGLAIEDILNKGKECPEVAHYLPEERDLDRLPKQWIADITYTVMKESFSKWVTERVKIRNDTIAENRNLIIELDPEVAEAFKKSLNISSKWESCECAYSVFISDILLQYSYEGKQRTPA